MDSITIKTITPELGRKTAETFVTKKVSAEYFGFAFLCCFLKQAFFYESSTDV